MTALRIHRVVHRTEAEGPGSRACVWVQGCSIRCDGCFNPGTWSPFSGQSVSPSSLAVDLGRVEGIEGLTIMGGEPFDQAEACATLAEGVRDFGLSTMVFTGYRYEELFNRDNGARRLLAATDLLVDGPYIRDQPEIHRPWIGSANQRFINLTTRYQDVLIDQLAHRNRVELRLTPSGVVMLNGMADQDVLTALRRAVRGPQTVEPASHA